MNRRVLFAPIVGALLLVLAACSTAPEFNQDFRTHNFGGTEGCTPGYWGRPQHFDSWPDTITNRDGGVLAIDQNTTLQAVFEDFHPALANTLVNFPDLRDDTLLEALNYSGTGGSIEGHAMKLLRHAVAAVLNEAVFPDTYGVDNIDPNITGFVRFALYNFGNPPVKNDIEDLKDLFEIENERGCPLN